MALWFHQVKGLSRWRGDWVDVLSAVLSRYAAAVVRKHPQELGCIREDELLAGNLDCQDFKRLPRADEAVVLRALLEMSVRRWRDWILGTASQGIFSGSLRSAMPANRSGKPRFSRVSASLMPPSDWASQTLRAWC